MMHGPICIRFDVISFITFVGYLSLLVNFDKETQNFYEVLSVLCEQMKSNFISL
jgi:hypothetical protein